MEQLTKMPTQGHSNPNYTSFILLLLLFADGWTCFIRRGQVHIDYLLLFVLEFVHLDWLIYLHSRWTLLFLKYKLK